MAPQQWRIQKDKSVLQVTSVTSLGEVTQKVWRSVFATVARLSTEQTSVIFSPCHGHKSLVKRV